MYSYCNLESFIYILILGELLLNETLFFKNTYIWLFLSE